MITIEAQQVVKIAFEDTELTQFVDDTAHFRLRRPSVHSGNFKLTGACSLLEH